jgi:ATP-dependent HslUV protease subunit HslV
MPKVRGTTILGVVRGGRAAMAGDGQVTLEDTILRHSARKVRKMRRGQVLVGYAGAAGDALALFERFEEHLNRTREDLGRAASEFARDWHSDRSLRRLEAELAAVDRERALLITAQGDVIESEDGIVAIGSGSLYALAACRALTRHTELDAPAIVKEALIVTASLCVFTNDRITVEEVGA